MEMDDLKIWLKERISALDGPLVDNGDLVRAKTYAEVLSKLEEPAVKLREKPLTHPGYILDREDPQPEWLRQMTRREREDWRSQQVTDD